MATLAKPLGPVRAARPSGRFRFDRRAAGRHRFPADWRPKAPAPTISRRWPGSRACCATAAWSTSCAPPKAPTRSTPCWSNRSRRKARLRRCARPGQWTQRRLELVLADQRLRDLDRGRGGHRLAVGGEDADRMRAVGQVDRLHVGDLLRAEAQEGLVREGREDALSARFPWLPPWQRSARACSGAR